MSHYPKLRGERVYLSPPAFDDADAWARWFNDLDVALPLGDEAYSPLTLEGAQADLRGMTGERMHVFSILTTAEDRLIGRALLFSLDYVNRASMLGIAIGEKDCWGQGYGREAMTLLIDYAFGILNLNSLMLGVYRFNARAVELYRSLGFRDIGVRRQGRIIAGQPHDVLFMDLLASEWLAARPSPFAP
jgi:RimJ/RimL family protein N-acetyltransferase